MPTANYILLRKRGPFAGMIDPWAEDERFFHRWHLAILEELETQLTAPLKDKGYIVTQAPSLQSQFGAPARGKIAWNYDEAATALEADPGTPIRRYDWSALHIKTDASQQTVTALEIISPRSKRSAESIGDYRTRRLSLTTQRGTHVIELDLTRSRRRMLNHSLLRRHDYYVGIYLAGEWPRLIPYKWSEPFKRIALPLRGAVIALELQAVLGRAYQQAGIAGLILEADGYHLEKLPHPDQLSEVNRAAALKAVEGWLALMRSMGA